ncbi:hypothetical protein B0T16DRAFT_11074 [Cercophora newfieldiana]|uniref:Uncharacterized protein n=1 Tax=Cercophora newfieldiana TaxID=92897 RepID=A0AA39YMZ1_9PEZI|nr:hypothetical protein B0T16DRAFT_11074 [Cercophora newfieldiana]
MFPSSYGLQSSDNFTMPLKPTEPIVPHPNRLPPGYRFLPKGNVYLTANCRKRTQLAGKTVFLVRPIATIKKSQLGGIGIPEHIYRAVAEAELATRSARADAVRRKDNVLMREFEAALLKQFRARLSRSSENGRAIAPVLRSGPGAVGGGVDDNSLVLTCDQLGQVDSFRTQLLDRTDDAEKFQLSVLSYAVNRSRSPRYPYNLGPRAFICHPRSTLSLPH